MKKLLILLTFLIILSSIALAITLPENLQNAFQQTLDEAKNISFLIAFLGGVLSILAPCGLATLPAFFAYTFKEKKEITKMTFVFFIGFSLIFIIYGLTASFFSSLLSNYKTYLSMASGILLIALGIMTLFGKGFSVVKLNHKVRHDVFGIFLFGIAFAIGFSPCLGPILAGILIIASTFTSYLSSALFLFVYSLGIFFPLFILSFIYDKFNLANTKFMKNSAISFKVNRKIVHTHLTNIIASILLILTGVLYLAFKNTSFINNIDIFGTKPLFYSLERSIIPSKSAEIIALMLLIILIILAIRFLRKKK